MKLNSKARDTVETLLNSYTALCSAEQRIGKRGQLFSLSANHEREDHDFISVGLDPAIAKTAIGQQKSAVAKELAKYKIDVSA